MIYRKKNLGKEYIDDHLAGDFTYSLIKALEQEAYAWEVTSLTSKRMYFLKDEDYVIRGLNNNTISVKPLFSELRI